MENGWIFPLRKLYGDLPTHRIHGAGIYANIGGILMVNVAIYSIHGSYGQRITVCRPWKNHQTHLAQYIYIYISIGAIPSAGKPGKLEVLIHWTWRHVFRLPGLVNIQKAIEAMAIEIVDVFPLKMVDLSIVFCTFTRG